MERERWMESGRNGGTERRDEEKKPKEGMELGREGRTKGWREG